MGRTMSKILTADEILGADDIRIESVEVPEWGGTVCVRGMTGAERDSYETTLLVMRGKTQELNLNNARAKLVALCACDESGKRIFEDDQVKALGKKSASALDRVFQAAQRLSGITEADIDAMTDGLKNAPSA